MKLPLYQIDAFTNTVFGGNPACVMPLEKWLPNDILLKIAKENAVAETAFFVWENDVVHLRWFTPEIEMDLCGHATLATAHCLKTILDYQPNTITFHTLSGQLLVTCTAGMYSLNFPARMPLEEPLPTVWENAFSISPNAVLKARDYVLVYDKEQAVRDIEINLYQFNKLHLPTGGVIITAPGIKCDFVSRFFTPNASIIEDPVTGSAHCSLIPYWAERLGKNTMIAQQLSSRLGTLYCEHKGNRVIMSGYAITYSEGFCYVHL